MGLSHFHYRNDTEPADGPVDPASEQNHMGPPGQYLTSLDSSGSVGLWSGILRVYTPLGVLHLIECGSRGQVTGLQGVRVSV